MNLSSTITIALRAIAKNKMRAALTIIGIVIGIAAVTTMVSIGMSARQLVLGQFDSFGTNMVIIFPEAQRKGGVRQGRSVTLTADDAQAIVDECETVIAASPMVFFGGHVIYGNANWPPNEIIGVGEQYLTVRNWSIRYGEFFDDRQIDSAAKVCVIGQTIVAKLFQTTNPLGETIRIGNIPFRVVGVLEPKGAALGGEDQDNIVLMPVTTVRKRLYGSNFEDVHVIFASARSANETDDARDEIERLLLDRHNIDFKDEADFRVRDSAEFAAILKTVTGILTLLLSSIAGISLLVGGVGIMNIMLVSVTERTREIGIRMAVGARGRDILWQFLIESVMLSCIGGLIGLGIGIAASAGATVALNAWMSGTSDAEWPLVVSLPAAGIAILFAAAVGIFFGYYPARRASKLDPIDALRFE
ncbi:MAG: ABC transporter permease [Planctomycetales bacterium]|nr:ABC transporter permease [Planctomycetales bacterium]